MRIRAAAAIVLCLCSLLWRTSASSAHTAVLSGHYGVRALDVRVRVRADAERLGPGECALGPVSPPGAEGRGAGDCVSRSAPVAPMEPG